MGSMECTAGNCQWNYRNHCLCGSSAPARERIKEEIDNGGISGFMPHIDIGDSGQCLNYCVGG